MALIRIGPGQYKMGRKRPDGQRKKAANAARWKLATLGVDGALKDLGLMLVVPAEEEAPDTVMWNGVLLRKKKRLHITLEELLAPPPATVSEVSPEEWQAETEKKAAEIEALMLAEAKQPVSKAELRRIKTKAWKRALLRNTR